MKIKKEKTYSDKISILVIDDDKQVHFLLKEMLSYYTVKGIQSEYELETLINKKHLNFKVIILDYKLKNKNGLDLVSRLKQVFPCSKIVLVTAFGNKEVLIKAIEYKLDAYIEKPLRKIQLTNKINNLLEIVRNESLEKVEYKKIINKIESILNSEKGYTFSLEKFASQNQLSVKYLSRSYNELTGKSFRIAKKNIILNTAKQYLTNTNISISSLSKKLGYTFPSAFMSFFRKEVGLSANEYKKLQQ